jgi:hypothetical protein
MTYIKPPLKKIKITEQEVEDEYLDLLKNAVSFEELQSIIQSLGGELERVENITYH